MVEIDWLTKTIFIHQGFLDTINDRVYKLDMDKFRMALKAIEESDEGIPHLDTHRHSTQKVLSGVTYARIIEIINGYMVKFDDADMAYTVSCVGANHNLADVKIVDHVSLLIGNSTGLQVVETPSVDTKKIIGHIWGAAK